MCVAGDGSLLYRQTLNTFNHALAPGTYANKYRQAQAFIKFAVIYNVPYLNPSILNVCMYSQYLANCHTSVSSIKNYLAGAKSWVLEHNGNVSAFISHEISMMNKSIAKKDVHVVKRAQPLSWSDIQKICIFLDSAKNAPLAVKPLILIAYTCFLRASNLVKSSAGPWAGPHTLLAKNIFEVSEGLIVVILSTKTRTRPYTMTISRLPAQQFCPVYAWHHYNQIVRPQLSSPAFIHEDRSPLSTTVVVALMRAALASDPNRNSLLITMHSLRRGAAQDSNKAGVSSQDIMKRGGWATQSGLKPYLLD